VELYADQRAKVASLSINYLTEFRGSLAPQPFHYSDFSQLFLARSEGRVRE
jgi:hypothetical protein